MEPTEEREDCCASDKLHKSDGDLRTSPVCEAVTFIQYWHVSRKKLSAVT